jgi:Mn2+/Fe2+ NRAMP family transporter
MIRLAGGVIAGLVIWIAGVTVLNLGLRHGLSGYAAVEKAMTFTLPMLVARLCISAVSSLVSGYGAARLGRGPRAATITGGVLLVIFLPVHVMLFSRFPFWYHLVFLTSLPLLSMAGARLWKA